MQLELFITPNKLQYISDISLASHDSQQHLMSRWEICGMQRTVRSSGQGLQNKWHECVKYCGINSSQMTDRQSSYPLVFGKSEWKAGQEEATWGWKSGSSRVSPVRRRGSGAIWAGKSVWNYCSGQKRKKRVEGEKVTVIIEEKEGEEMSEWKLFTVRIREKKQCCV